MSQNNDDFTNNPFLKLDPSKYPRKSSSSNPSQKGQTDRKMKRGTGAEDTENELFLRAMAGRINPPKSRLLGGFAMSEQCVMPEVGKKTTKNKSANPQLKSVKNSSLEKKITDEETAAFLLAMRNIEPLDGKGRKVVPPPPASEPPGISEPCFEELLADNLTFAVSCSDEYMEGHVTGLDTLLMNRLRQGQFSPEAHLDLHGLNTVQAFESLRDFMRGAWFKGLRAVLLVPGRGKNSPDGQGILRPKLQSWLTQEPFKRVVLAFCTAQPHDGGPGSIYVLLRKYRKKGRVYWERLPADADLYLQ